MKFNLIISALFFLFISACSHSHIGLGVGKGKGNFYTEEKENVFANYGGYIEYRWKKMFSENSWSDNIKRHGYGIDYNLQLSDFGGFGFYFHSIQGKYYYTLLESKSHFLRMDIAAGLGYGHHPTILKYNTSTLVSNISSDIYFNDFERIYVSPKLNYMYLVSDKRYNVAFEVMVGVRF